MFKRILVQLAREAEEEEREARRQCLRDGVLWDRRCYIQSRRLFYALLYGLPLIVVIGAIVWWFYVVFGPPGFHVEENAPENSVQIRGDIDDDGVRDDQDNCPFVPNPGQQNIDLEFDSDFQYWNGLRLGDVCDPDRDIDPALAGIPEECKPDECDLHCFRSAPDSRGECRSKMCICTSS